MNIKNIISTIAFCILATTSVAQNYTRDNNYITIKMQGTSNDGPKLVRLQVINDKIIRVEATRDASFPQKKSLIIIPQTQFNKFNVIKEGNNVVVKTSDVKASVDTKTGRTIFFDKNGKVLLSETQNGGKTFKPFTVPADEIGVGTLTDAQSHGWTWHALFDSPADEALYGLGQHQSEDFNYKGKNEELYQYNTKISVPFIMSNKGYGLLWDSYSLCRWGNPNDYQQLNRAFTLYDKDGKQGSITGTYTDKDGKSLVRTEDSLYFADIQQTPNLPKGFNLKDSKVVYEGFIEAPVSSIYRFILYYAGYMKVFIGGQQVVAERWRTSWNPNSWKFTCKLNKGERTPIRIEWMPDGETSYCALRAAVPQTEDEQNRISIWSEMNRDMDYYFIAGSNMDQVISGYRTLTGKAQVMPKWALGFWQSRERYQSSNDIESTLKEFRDRHVPIDNIVQDWNYWPIDSWGSHQFEKCRYPNPQAMLDSVHAMHGRFMISVWPKFYCTTANYKELDANGWIYQQAAKDSIHDWLGYVGSFYDAYSAGARKMFWRQVNDNMYSKFHFGIDAWWMDASEPNVRDCTPIKYRKALCGPTALGSSTEYFNAYANMNADAIYNGQRGVNPNQRVFLLTRSGFAGLQRFSTASWSGDIGTRWEDMRAQMTAGMNYCMSGIPFWGMDQGGFSVENRYMEAQKLYDKTGEENENLKEWRELQTRWNQFGCFIPLYRTHGQWPLREIWNIAPNNHPAYQSILYYDQLRYRLMPYLYSIASWAHFDDYTLMRGLVMDFMSDSKVNNIADQWMFGPSLMACPVSQYKARTRQVYLPKQCGWYDLYTGKHFIGGQTITADAPYERIPVFVPEGSIIPFGPQMEWSDQKPAELINLYVYGGRDGKFKLYEDENTNYNYEKGAYATIEISYNAKQNTVTIGKRNGSFPGMLVNRRFNIVIVNSSSAAALNLDSPKGKMVNYSGKETTIKL
jgi:alpha-D-xyloside xylohydrolase